MNTNSVENTEEKLKIENMLLKQRIEYLESKLQVVDELLRLSVRKQFGSSSEKNFVAAQLSLFDQYQDDDSAADSKENKLQEESPIEEVTYKRRKKVGHRKEQLEGLPVETIEYRIPEEEQVCDCCHGQLHEMSKEVRKEVVIIPATLKVVEHVSYIYACRSCEKESITVPIKKAQAPRGALPGSPASASAIAYVMSQKFVDSMPLYRLEKHFERMGITFSRQTMSNWMINAYERWLKVLYEHMKKELLRQKIIHCDETTLQVLREKDRAPQTKSYMWLYRSGKYGIPIVLYDYQPSRGGKCPKKFLEGFSGHIHVDGYAGYNKVDNARFSACWAHARRAFVDALKALPANVKPESHSLTVSNEGLEYCNRIFEVERLLKDEAPDVRFIERLKKSKPILDEFKKWLDYNSEITLPQGKAGKAIKYCLNIWDKLIVFLEHGMLEIDNNRAERSIKPFVIARKNFLFCNTPKGAEAAAVIFSITESAKESGLNPFEYLKYLFETMPNLDDFTENQLDNLVPWSSSLPYSCRVKKQD